MATQFQEMVWQKLTEIPVGSVVTYGELARAVGKPRAARAVGSACGANPNLVAVPCHRVVATNGQVGHYAGGTDAKIQLLRKEGIQIQDKKIINFETVQFHWN